MTVAILDRFRNEFAVADTQRFLHAVAQSLASEGFWQEVIGSRSQCMSARDFSAHSRNEHDRNSRRGRVAPEDLTNRKAIDIRQPHIEQDEIGRMTPDKGKPVRSKNDCSEKP